MLWKIIEDVKSWQPKGKASILDKRLLSYGHFKICMISDPWWFNMECMSLTLAIQGAGAYSPLHSRLVEIFLTTLMQTIVVMATAFKRVWG